jgi:hypothetical protein
MVRTIQCVPMFVNPKRDFVRARVRLHLLRVFLCVSVRVRARARACMRACVYVRACVRSCVRACVRVRARARTCVLVSARLHLLRRVDDVLCMVHRAPIGACLAQDRMDPAEISLLPFSLLSLSLSLPLFMLSLFRLLCHALGLFLFCLCKTNPVRQIQLIRRMDEVLENERQEIGLSVG